MRNMYYARAYSYIPKCFFTIYSYIILCQYVYFDVDISFTQGLKFYASNL